MSTPLVTTARKSRGIILTEQAVEILNQALDQWWERSEERQFSRTKKLTREMKASALGLEMKTVDKVFRRIPVDAVTLQAAFDRLKIQPPFTRERYCVAALPTDPPNRLANSNLPSMPTRCIGRHSEIAAVRGLLESSRLVTLTGTAGVGKTRLAIQIGEEESGQFTDGVWFVDLTGLARDDTPEAVIQKIAMTWGIREVLDRPLIQSLADYLSPKALLIILDNCEHLLSACASLAQQLLSSCAHLRILATSRENLNILFERPYLVPPLSVPELSASPDAAADTVPHLLKYDSVRLFVERAGSLYPDFRVTTENAHRLALICYRLEGIPLALELAAARVSSMPLDHLESELRHCLQFLTGGSRTALPRQQTLRGALDWSYDLLNGQEQTLLRRLSVFAGGCSREAVERVCSDAEVAAEAMVDLLDSLVKKSLVLYQEWKGAGRYRLLEPVRQYCQEQLAASGEQAALQTRHMLYFLDLAERVEPKLTTSTQAEWLERLAIEQGNLSAALARSYTTGHTEISLRFCGSLGRFWLRRGDITEGRRWCSLALTLRDTSLYIAERAKTLYSAGALAYFLGDSTAALAYLDESLSLFRQTNDKRGIASCHLLQGHAVPDLVLTATYYKESLSVAQEIEDPQSIALALNGLGNLYFYRGDYANGLVYLRRSLRLFRKTGDIFNIANVLKNLGAHVYQQGEYAAMTTYLHESLALFRQLESPSGIAATLEYLAYVALDQEDNELALHYLDECEAIYRSIGNQDGIAYCLNHRGAIAQSRHDIPSAETLYHEALSIFQEVGTKTGMAASLRLIADLLAQSDERERAVTIWAGASTIWAEYGTRSARSKQEAHERLLAQTRQTLGEARFAVARDIGQRMTGDAIIEYALDYIWVDPKRFTGHGSTHATLNPL